MTVTQPAGYDAADEIFPGVTRSVKKELGAWLYKRDPGEFDEELESVYGFTRELPRAPNVPGDADIPSETHPLEQNHTSGNGGCADADSQERALVHATKGHNTGEAGSPRPARDGDMVGQASIGGDVVTTRPHPRTPNLALRRARQLMRLSQSQFADAVRAAGNAMGVVKPCSHSSMNAYGSCA